MAALGMSLQTMDTLPGPADTGQYPRGLVTRKQFHPPSTVPNSGELRRSDRKRQRREARAGLWAVSKLVRPARCGRVVVGNEVAVHQVPNGDALRGAVTGLETCGSIWACPVCSAHIRQERASEIAAGTTQHLQRGGGALLGVFTVPHQRGDRLDTLMNGMTAAWASLSKGAPWQRIRERFGIVGMVRAWEATDGANGWHPHFNVLLFTDRPLSAGECLQLETVLHDRWSRMVQRRGLGEPSSAHGVNLQVVNDAETVGRYAAKVQEETVGLEVARGDLKDPRSRDRWLPFEILYAAAQGESWALNRWWEYERATHGRKCFTWTRGMRELLELGEEREDGEIVEDHGTSDETLLGYLTAATWALVCSVPGGDHLVLTAAESSSCKASAWAAVLSVIDQLQTERRVGYG